MQGTAGGDQGGRRYEIGAEPDRADEPVLDPDQRDTSLFGRFGEFHRRARSPNGDAASGPAAGCRNGSILGTPKDRRASTRPQKTSDLPTLPARHSEANPDIPIYRFDFLPLSEDFPNVFESARFPPV